MSYYVLTKGDYSRNRNVMITSDVKKISEKYVELINQDSFDNPYIEIWNENDIDYPTAHFHENERNLKRLIKYLSKLSRGIK